MELFESDEARKDKLKIKKSYPKAVQQKLVTLITEMLTNPYEETGKPEALKYALTGLWSRRLTNKERIVYYVEDESLNIVRYLSPYGKK
ncbi:MAG: Txe/YoeB family addiction module toxin [Bacteroidales bacterium]|jgi:toxin YoeB|nr:Txe/YoeB family addiction module toxin [Bacteroidales bacterium]